MSDMDIINSAGERIPITREGCAEVMLLRETIEELKALLVIEDLQEVDDAKNSK